MGTKFEISDTFRKGRPAKYGLDYYSPWALDSNGKRKRKKEFFRTKEKRKNRRDALEEKWRKFGESGEEPLSPAQIADYRAAVALLPEGVSVRAAAAVYSQHLTKTHGKPLRDVFHAYAGPGGELEARGISRETIKKVRLTLERFAAAMPAKTTIKGPKPDDIRLWLAKLKGKDKNAYSDATLHGMRRRLHGAFEWAAATEGLRDDNPVSIVSAPKIHRSSPVFYTVDETRKILAAAIRTDPEFVPILALRFFVGIRASEVSRMIPSDVIAERRIIDLPGFRVIEGLPRPRRVTKSGKRRIIEDAPDNLWKWLASYPLTLAKEPEKEGEKKKKKARIPVLAGIVNYAKRFRAVMKAADVRLKQNAPRHNFATYHVALKKSASLTIAILGQEENSTVFYTYYRNPNVTSDVAALYFGLTPRSRGAELCGEMTNNP